MDTTTLQRQELIHISSHAKDVDFSGTDNTFTTTLREELSQHLNISSIVPTTFSVTHSFENINKYNNKIWLQTHNPAIATYIQELVIPIGQYSSEELARAFVIVLDEAFDITLNPNGFKWSQVLGFDPSTNSMYQTMNWEFIWSFLTETISGNLGDAGTPTGITVELHRYKPDTQNTVRSGLYDILGFTGDIHELTLTKELEKLKFIEKGHMELKGTGKQTYIAYKWNSLYHIQDTDEDVMGRWFYYAKDLMDKTTSVARKNTMPVDARGPRSLYISLNGISRGGFSITNFGGNDRHSHTESNEMADSHILLNVPVNAPYGGVITKTFDDVYANGMNSGLTRELQGRLNVTIYDERMNILQLNGQSIFNLTLKKFGNEHIDA